MKEPHERHLICGASGDRGELAEFFILRIDKTFLENVDMWLQERERIELMTPGAVDITERGTVEFYVAYDFPDGDHSPFFQSIEEWDFYEKPMLLPEGSYEAARLGNYGKVRRTECHGFQVWPALGHVRLTCYPREDSYRIESSTDIGEILSALSRNFRWEQEY